MVKAIGCGPIIREFDPHTSHQGRSSPIGDGSCLENSRGIKALESSTLSPSALFPSSNGRTPGFGPGDVSSNLAGKTRLH